MESVEWMMTLEPWLVPQRLAGTTEAGSKGGDVTTEGNDGRWEQVQEDVGLFDLSAS